jgi:hypothetical protein
VSSARDEVPRLPRGRGLRLSRIELLRIAGLAILLVFLLATQRQCADAVSTFVTSFGDQKPTQPVQPPAATTGSGSADVDLDRYEHLRPGMTDAEMKATIERAKAKAAAQKTEAPAAK